MTIIGIIVSFIGIIGTVILLRIAWDCAVSCVRGIIEIIKE